MEEENVEQEILLEPEYAVISPVTSVNGKIGDVVLTTSDLENDSDYQTGTEVQTAIDTAIAGKQDTLTAGNGININAQNTISVDTTVVATQQNLSDEVTNRENADNALQSQIDAISASSDVVDIVGTYAELQNYDTSGLGDNDIIKVLQDSTQNDATTYYRWSTTTQTFTLIGQEGPYYTKASADAQFVPQTRTVNGKPLSANITLNASDVSALSPSDVDTQLANSTNPVQNKVLYGLLGDMPSDFFSGDALASAVTGTTLRIQNALSLDDMKMYGDTFQQTYSGKNLFNKDAAPQGGYLATYSALSTGVRAAAASTVNYTYIRYVMNVENYVGQTLTLSATASASVSNLPALAIGTCDSAGNNRVPKATQTGTGELTVSYTIESGDQYIYLNFYANQVGTAQVGDYADYENAQLEIGSATDYQPFVGGTASPNPDYPQNIDVVTGVQTVTVDDGGSNSRTYTIDLGSIELCKIGDYQDYIYKSGDDWYVHKDIGKVVYDGTQNWAFESYAFFRSSEEPIINSTVAIYAISDKFLGYNSSNSLSAWNNYPNNVIAIRNRTTYAQIGIKTDVASTAADFKTWLTSNPTTVYYVLQAPTDTQITDQTLIDGLNSALNMTCYDGETNVVVTSTSLAGALELVAVNANAKGLIYKARQ